MADPDPGDAEALEVFFVRITTAIQTPLRWEDFDSKPDELVPYEAHAASLAEHRPAVDQAAGRMLEPMRIQSRQYKAMAQMDTVFLGAARLFDVAAGRALIGGLAEAPPSSIASSAYLTSAHLRDAVQMPQVPTQPSAFLLDLAERAACNSPRTPSVAVVLAAGACEISVTAWLRSETPPDRRGLLDELMKRRPTHQSLYGPLMSASVGAGRSLLEVDGPLHAHLVELIAERNRVIHRGARVTQAVAERHVRTARQVSDWLHSQRSAKRV